MSVYISESSYFYYCYVLYCTTPDFILLLSLVFLILLLLAIFYYELNKYFFKRDCTYVLFLQTERDIWRCTLCIRIMCLVYIAVILSLNCIFVFLSTAVQEVPDTELQHCEDIFNLTGDTSHKFLHQVAMEQNLHCIDINITDGLLSVVLVIILSVLIIALNSLVLLKCTENIKHWNVYTAFKVSFIVIYIVTGIIILPKIVNQFLSLDTFSVPFLISFLSLFY